MYWQIRQDFRSLFKRGKTNTTHLDPIDGLRSIANLSIMFVHISMLFSAFIPPYPDVKWQEYLQSATFAFNNILILNLEIFFMLSGFLLTYKLITQWNQDFPPLDIFLFKEYPVLIIRRALRFWPGMILANLLMYIFGEPRYPGSGFLFEFFRHFNIWIFCQNYIDLEYFNVTFAPLWTISLDMQIYIILPLILYLFYFCRKYLSIYNSLSILLIISIIRGMIVFNPVTMPILSIAYRYPSLPLLSPNHLTLWIERNYNITFSFDYSESNPMKLFMKKMSLPLEARFGSFIIGAMLAIKLLQIKRRNHKPKKWKKFFFFALIAFQIFILIQRPNLVVPSNLVLRGIIASSRQLFAIGQAFLLFTTLCPYTHNYHSSWIRRFLSLPIWIPISKLSYLVYLIHWRIAFVLIFGGPLRFLEMYSVTYASLISLLIILLIVEPIACIWFLLVEKPVERIVQDVFDKTHAY